MTIPQIKGFMGAILRRTATLNAVTVSNIAVGAQCDSKTIKETIDSYTEQVKAHRPKSNTKTSNGVRKLADIIAEKEDELKIQVDNLPKFSDVDEFADVPIIPRFSK